MTILLMMLALSGGPPVEYTQNMASGIGYVPCDQQCRRERRMWRRVKPWNAKLGRMAGCESGRRWNLNTGNSFYGGLQFTLGTWQASGGSGYPHHASRLEQKYRAVIWHDKIGTWVTTAGWPVCGYA